MTATEGWALVITLLAAFSAVLIVLGTRRPRP